MKSIYVQVKFQLNEGIKIEEWKKLSDNITADMQGTDGLQFRESAVDEKGNVYCILKWDTIEQRTVFFEGMQKDMKENPENYAEFGRIGNMKTMTMDILTVV